MSTWDVRREREGESLFADLSTEELRELYSTQQVGPMDWARPDPAYPWRQMTTWDEVADITHAQRRRRNRQGVGEEEMDMTPMIDITFLLLIFFMITATFDLQKGLAFPPEKPDKTPENESAPGLAAVQQQQLVLKIGANDTFQLLGDNQQPGPEISADDLVDTLREKSQAETKSKLLILPHDSASHEAVVLAIDSSAQAGITEIAIADIQAAADP